jgi:hypothetical protein
MTKKVSNKKSKKEYSLQIEGIHKDFKDFFDNNKGIIYTKVIDIFQEFKTSRKKSITLSVVAQIDNMEWDTKFNFFKNESIVLKRDILPYFETIEDYETCQKINNLYNDLTSSN